MELGGFVFQTGAKTDGDTVSKAREGLAGWCLMAAKHVKESLHCPIVDGRCFSCVSLAWMAVLVLRERKILMILSRHLNWTCLWLVKTLGLEWPSVFVRAADVHVEPQQTHAHH